MQGWFLGSEAGHGLADVLTGKVNPSGKLPFTWPASLNDVGAHALDAFPGVWRADKKVIDEEYKEGFYVGYRWVDFKKTKPNFAFGHGLSYTTFQLSNLRVVKKANSQDVDYFVDVTNTGKVAGSEVVQLYLNDVKCTQERPAKELKAFQKVFLQPGESTTVQLHTDRRALCFWDEASNDWKYEAGEFIALVGNASDNLSLKAKFTIE